MNVDKNEKLSLCYVGGVVTRNDEEYRGIYEYFCEIIRLCEINKCYFHAYPVIWDEKKYKEYLELEEKNKYFHFHRPIVYERLRYELLKYDFGIQIAEKGYHNELYKNEKNIYGVANHLFDYLDAGLPIIGTVPANIISYLKNEEVVLMWNIEQYDFDYLLSVKTNMREKVYKLREKLKISNNIDKLIEFYDSI